MKLIVGLGNPGKEYNSTRHNIGFIILDYYLENCGWKQIDENEFSLKTIKNVVSNFENSGNWQSKFNGLISTISYENEKILFLKPQTYMNLSGQSVAQCANFYKIKPQDILVIRDDLDLPFNKIRLKPNSSSGGHNGIKSILDSMNTKTINQLKFGISSDYETSTSNYVLANFTKKELDEINKSLKTCTNIINSYIINGIEKTKNRYNI